MRRETAEDADGFIGGPTVATEGEVIEYGSPDRSTRKHQPGVGFWLIVLFDSFIGVCSAWMFWSALHAVPATEPYKEQEERLFSFVLTVTACLSGACGVASALALALPMRRAWGRALHRAFCWTMVLAAAGLYFGSYLAIRAGEAISALMIFFSAAVVTALSVVAWTGWFYLRGRDFDAGPSSGGMPPQIRGR